MIIREAETPLEVTLVRYSPSVQRTRQISELYIIEHHIAKISSADHAFAVSSGMAALDVILRLLKPGDEVIAGDDLYGGTNRLLTYIRTHVGVTVHHVDTTNPTSLHAFIHPTKTAMVLLESPTNPLLKIADLATISKDVKERSPNAIIIVDNTMMSPYLQRPLEHGADVVYDSATKYLSGHHDLMAGVITCNRDDIAKVMSRIPQCEVLLRVLKTFFPTANSFHNQLYWQRSRPDRRLPASPRH
jgi:cystathionine beta-lyase/cystathionine gamma-synthase